MQAAKGQGVPCGERVAIIGQLEKLYGETVIFRGLFGEEAVFELIFSSRTSTWTAAITQVGGIMCILGVGEDGEMIKRLKPPGTAL